MGKQTEKTNRFRKEEDWTQNQICTTRVSKRIGVVGLWHSLHWEIFRSSSFTNFAILSFWGDVLLCTSRQSEYTDMASRGGGGDRQETNIHCQYFLHIFPLSTTSTFGSWPVSSFLSPRDFLLSQFLLYFWPFLRYKNPPPSHLFFAVFWFLIILSDIPPLFVCSHLFTQRTLSSSPWTELLDFRSIVGLTAIVHLV